MEYVRDKASDPTLLGPEVARRRPPGSVCGAVLGAGLLAVLVWQFAGVAEGGQSWQVINPALGPIWKVVILAAVAVSAASSLLAWVRRQWTVRLALVNTLGNAVAAVVVIWLTLQGWFFAEAVPTAIGTFLASTDPSAAQNAGDVGGATDLFVLIVLGVALWDSLNGILRAPGVSRRHDAM